MRPRTLQHLDLGVDPATEMLHYTFDHGGVGRHAVVDDDGGPLRIPGGVKVSFDAYFNCFYENYWLHNTDLEDVALHLDLQGKGVVSVFRQSAQGPTYLVRRQPYDLGDVDSVVIDVTRDSGFSHGPGRLWFEVEAEHDTMVVDGSWTTPSQGRDVVASVVFCTFNREAYLARILRALASNHRVHREIARVIVVNQGEPFDLEDLLPDAAPDLARKIEIIEQANMGGCGGFTRGMLETFDDPDLTHFILLDDDIKLHSESLYRGIQFLRHAHDDVVVGGHMLDLVNPNNLYEAGAKLDPAIAEPRPLLHGLHLKADNLEEFLDMPSVDYNGWWFFGASTAVVTDVGLPMPSFIRGDDIEFGVRLKRHGYRTVAMPGIAVWHEPFYLKLGNWQFYFEVRNRLAMLSLHGNGDIAALKRHWRRVFTRDAMLARYHSCEFMIAGLRDYLAGTDQVFVTTDDALMARLAEMRTFGPTKVADHGTQTVRELSTRDKRITKLAFPAVRAARLVVPVRDGTVPTMRADQATPWRLGVFDRYRIIDPSDGTVWEFERDREVERRQLAEFEQLMKQLTLYFDDSVVDRRAGIAWLARWREILATEGDDGSIATTADEPNGARS